MRQLLNTLYLTKPESYICKDGTNIVVTVSGEEVFRIPVLNIEGIVTFGYTGASPGAMKLCADNGVALTFLTPSGKFIARSQGPVHGNVLLRQEQYRIADDSDRSLRIARLFISGKIHNYQQILLRFCRDYGECPDVTRASALLGNYKQKAYVADSHDELRGFEGQAAAAYFDVFNNLLTQQRGEFHIAGRNKRPPRDPVNAMLSFVYTLIAHETTAALEAVGLDPYVGFMHTVRPGRPSLALDIMEEMRAYLGDRLVISMINRRQVNPNDFVRRTDSEIVMTDDCRKKILTAWQNRKREIITHPYLQEKIPVGLLPYAQSMLLARKVRNDIDDYPVFLLK